MSSQPVNRRSFLSTSAALLFLTACGTSNELTPQGLGVRFPDGFRAPSVAVTGHGPQRFPFVIVANDGLPMTTGAPEQIAIEVLFGGETLSVENVAVRGAGQFTPYYPLTFTPEQPGVYSARTEFTDFDVEFVVVERGDTPLFQVGDALPPFQTPTMADPAGVNPVCSRSPEPCQFHELTLAEALSNGKPTAMLIATPAWCQTDVCGSNLEWLIELAASRSDINVIHAEVYADFDRDVSTGQLPIPRAPMLEEWDIAFEPSLFIANADGTIIDARHFAFDRAEMDEALALI